MPKRQIQNLRKQNSTTSTRKANTEKKKLTIPRSGDEEWEAAAMLTTVGI